MPVVKYENLFISNVKTELKVDALAQIDKWILDEVQMVFGHGTDPDKARAMEELLKMEKSPLTGLY